MKSIAAVIEYFKLHGTRKTRHDVAAKGLTLKEVRQFRDRRANPELCRATQYEMEFARTTGSEIAAHNALAEQVVDTVIEIACRDRRRLR